LVVGRCRGAFQVSDSGQGAGARQALGPGARRAVGRRKCADFLPGRGRRRPGTELEEGGLTMAFSPSPDLLHLATAGDRNALNELAPSIAPHAERQLLRYRVADEDRRDLLQTTLMQVVRRLGSFRGDSSFSTWLFRVTANEAL